MRAGRDHGAPISPPEELDELAALGSKQAVFARDVMQGILQFYRTYRLDGVAFHDPVTVLYADDD